MIDLTKHCLSNKYKVRELEIAETVSFPGDILALDDLTNVLNKETWIEHLTEAERNNLFAVFFFPTWKNRIKLVLWNLC